MEAIYINAFIYTLLSYLLTYLIGHTLVSFIKIPARFIFLKEFTRLCAGFFTVLTVYSIIRTHGITINTGIIFLFIALIIWLKKNDLFRPRDEIVREFFSLKSYPYIAIQLGILILSFVYLFLKIIKNNISKK